MNRDVVDGKVLPPPNANSRGRIAQRIREGLERGRMARADALTTTDARVDPEGFTPVVVLSGPDGAASSRRSGGVFVGYRWVASSGALVSAIWLFSIGLTVV